MIHTAALTSDDFLLDVSTGIYTATISSSVHGLNTGTMHMTRCVKRNSDRGYDNIFAAFDIDSNGDFHLYVEETGTIRVTLTDE